MTKFTDEELQHIAADGDDAFLVTADEARAMAAELLACHRDARRYRHIRERGIWSDMQELTGDVLDAATDKAMQEKP